MVVFENVSIGDIVVFFLEDVLFVGAAVVEVVMVVGGKQPLVVFAGHMSMKPYLQDVCQGSDLCKVRNLVWGLKFYSGILDFCLEIIFMIVRIIDSLSPFAENREGKLANEWKKFLLRRDFALQRGDRYPLLQGRGSCIDLDWLTVVILYGICCLIERLVV